MEKTTLSTESPTPEELKAMQELLQRPQTQQTSQSGNPLAAYMRTPQIYIKLPSGGKYYPEGTLEIPDSGELAVLPMSTRDELIIKTPDALINGQSTVDVIEHCIPGIKDAWQIPLIDLDYLLISIRIASYGENMEFTSKCPKCEEFNEYEIDLRIFLDQKIDIDAYEDSIEYKDLKLKFRPQNYRTLNMNNQEVFEQQRMFNVLNDSTLDSEEKEKRYNEVFKRLTEINVKQIGSMIDYIELPTGERVDNRKFIDEFVENSDRKVFDALEKHSQRIAQGIPEKTLPANCPDCQHSYTTPFTFDYANFFGTAS